MIPGFVSVFTFFVNSKIIIVKNISDFLKKRKKATIWP